MADPKDPDDDDPNGFTDGQDKINQIEDAFDEVTDVLGLMNEPELESLQEAKDLANAAIAMIDTLISELEP